MIGVVPAFEQGALESLDGQVERTLRSDAAPAPEIVSFGEISVVLALRGEWGQVACKRLPPFRSEDDYAAYASCLAAQVATMRWD